MCIHSNSAAHTFIDDKKHQLQDSILHLSTTTISSKQQKRDGQKTPQEDKIKHINHIIFISYIMPRRISLSKTKRKNFKILLRLLFLHWYKKCLLFLGGFGILTILCYNNRSLSSSSTTSSTESTTTSSFLRTGAAEHAGGGGAAGSASNAQDSNNNNNNKNNNIALRTVKSRPNQAKWMNMTREAWHEELGCDKLTIRPVHTPEIWIGMREAYISVVGQEKATVPSTTTTTSSSSSESSFESSLFKTAFQIPFEVRQSPGMGRGIYTLIDVKKGQLLYDFSQTAQYRYANEFAEFLRIITPELACDVLMWSYVQDLSEGYTEKMLNEYGPFRIMTDLDPGSFCNNGGKSKGNMAWIMTSPTTTTTTTATTATNRKTAPLIGRYDTVKSAPLVALRDIDAGEELLCIYSQFSEGLNRMIE